MFKRIRTGLLCMVLAAASTVAIAQSFTTFVNARVVTQLDLQGQLTANGSTGTTGQALTSNGAGDVTWSTVAGGVTGLANPTGTIGLTAVNGAATTAIRSDGAPALSQAIAPTWSAGHVFGLARTNATAPLLLSSTTTALRFFETDAAANNTRWEWAVNAEQLRLALLDDTGALTGTAMLVDRTAGTVDSIALTSTALTWNTNTLFTTANDGSGSGLDADLLDGLNSTAFGLLGGTNAWTQNNSFSANVLISSAGPTFRLNETDAAVDNRLWDVFVNTEQLSWRVVDDAISSGVSYLTVNRTANVVDSIALAATSITLNGVASSDFARLSQSNTFTGSTQQITNTGGARLVLRDPDATADEQCFFAISQTDTFNLFASEDANCTSTTNATSFFQVTRTGTTVDDVRFPNGTVRVSTAASPAAVISPTIANITSRSNTTGVIASFQVNGSAATEATQSLTRANGANSAGPILFLNKSRGTISAPTTVVASGDDIGRIVFSGSDSANFSNGAEISAQVDGTPGAGDMPGRLLFSTTADGATLPTERMRISSTGLVTIAGDATVSGKVTATNGVTATAGVNAGNRLSMSTQSPTSLAADVNNWALTPVPIVLIAASTGGINITGIDATTANADAQSLGNNAILHFINTSSQRLTLDHESASSTAANRFSLPNSQAFGIAPGASVSVYYDSVVSRWRTISAGIQTEVFAFTLNFTNGCTTTPTMLMSAAKFGNVVSMRINGSMSSCTGDATSFGTSADVPAALIPDANSCFAMGNAASDNGLAVSANFCIQSDGTVVIHECPLDGVAGFGCAASTWTASGTRFLGGLSMVFTYNLDQV